MEERSTLVYVSGEGRIKEKPKINVSPSGDGVVRLSLKKLGGNKSVTIVSGLSLEEENLKQLCSELKRKCATGGTIKNWDIEIQGDRRNLLKQELEKKGIK
ncbi:MAG: stress response translation initiation inhibitor YciH [Fibrobacteraceae bacterium]|nr:stress response translation initiation inhibitor YciH [Fibrobacteraceae bacterium]